jgi:flagellar capping protein FliD
MRLTTTATALVALLVPVSVLASNTTATETLTSTVTRTLVLVNATATVRMPTASTHLTSATLTGTSSYASATHANYLGNGAGSDQSNLLIIGLAGAAIVAFGSL